MEQFTSATDERSQETRSLTGDLSSAHLPLPTGKSFLKSSYDSFIIFKDVNFFDPNSERYCKKSNLFEGPRRFCRFCMLGLLVPVVLISIPLYLRLILYPPTHITVSPTDQRLISSRTSSVWCQGQTVEMNGSFNAFLLDEPPRIRQQYSTHTMKKHLVLKDDFKEYWGFFLQKGSIVSIDLCNRYDGGSLMIIRGVHNLRKCAWIGEKDSAEQDDDLNEASNESSNESGQINEYYMAVTGGITVQRPGINNSLRPDEERRKNTPMNSEERKEELDYFIKRILSLGKNSKEIDMHLKKNKNLLSNSVNDNSLKASELVKEPLLGKANNEIIKKRFKRQLTNVIENSAIEEVDSLETDEMNKENIIMEKYNLTKNELYKKIFHLPVGLVFERGTFFQRENNDSSNEEQRSSFSSSEEALLKCEGLLGAIQIYPDRECVGPDSPASNKVNYKIPQTGTYYFVFSSDNEVFDSDMYFNMTLQKRVFNTDYSKSTCINQTTCSLSFSFWSHDQTIIEIPEGDWDSSFIVNSKCQPRVLIYLIIIILVPLFILCSALT